MNYFDLNMDLSEGEAALKTNANKFAREVMRPISIQLDQMTPEEAIAPGSPFWDFMRKAYELGYHTVGFPTEVGGSGLTPLQCAIVNEELAWGSFGMTLGLNTTLDSLAALLFGTEEHIKEFTVPYCQCKDASVVGCWAITEPDHGSDTVTPGYHSFRDPTIKAQCVARLKGNEYVINGQKSAWVSGGTIAKSTVLMCQIDPSMGHAGSGIFVFSLDRPGVSKGKPLNRLGTRDLNQGEVFFDDVHVPKESLLVGPEGYEAALEGWLGMTLPNVATWCTGLARAGFEEALTYARERVQGGKLLIEHPSVQEKLFDMFRKVEASRQLSRAVQVYNWSHAMQPEKRLIEYGMAAKTFASQAALEVTSEAIQIFGGIGISKEYILEKLFRDAQATIICDATNNIHAIVGGDKVARTYPRS